MKKIITLGLALVAGLAGVMAQSLQPTEKMMKEFRQTIQKRDISQRHLDNHFSLSSTPQTNKAVNALPSDRVWFPGEWEEVQAVVVTPYYDYVPAEPQGSGYWMADPLMTGIADYYQYNNGWHQSGHGPYKAIIDSNSTFGMTFFYLMDAIQLGGAQAWVRVEASKDSLTVLRTLQRKGLRHDNIRFIVGSGNSFWYRDCGPICFYYGDKDSVAMLDFGYYPGRALDDSLPSHIHHQMGLPNYITDIEWEGGNCLVDGAGMVFSSDALYSNNNDRYGQLSWDGRNYNSINYTQKTPLSNAETKDALRKLLGQRSTIILPAYQYDGGTGHIDLYADMFDENGFVFTTMPSNYSNWHDYRTGVANIDSLCSYTSIFNSEYYTMAELPFPSTDNGGNFPSESSYNTNYTRTYSNHTFVNNIIMQPVFSAVVNGLPTAQWDLDNYRAIEAAYPGYTLYPIDVREFDGSGGAIHCITKQIPAENPIRILHKHVHGNVNASITNVPVSAIITNNSGIQSAKCIYRVNSGAWDTIALNANGNKFSGVIPADLGSYEYFISATSNNGKTITKPMTAAQGGYFSFTIDNTAENDSSIFDFSTDAVANENITFLFSSQWAHEDHSEPLSISQVADKDFGQFYPNPSRVAANININLGSGETYNVSIIDMAGRTIHTSALTAAGEIVYTINASKLNKGIYNVVFSSKSGRIIRRLIVE